MSDGELAVRLGVLVYLLPQFLHDVRVLQEIPRRARQAGCDAVTAGHHEEGCVGFHLALPQAFSGVVLQDRGYEVPSGGPSVDSPAEHRHRQFPMLVDHLLDAAGDDVR